MCYIRRVCLASWQVACSTPIIMTASPADPCLWLGCNIAFRFAVTYESLELGLQALGDTDGDCGEGLASLLVNSAARNGVADDNGADARGRAGEDAVAFLKREERGDVRNELGNAEEHVAGVAALALLAVDVKPKVNIGRVGDGRGRNEGRDGRERVHALGDGPGKALLLGLLLDLARGHVQTEEVTGDVGHRGRNGDVATALADDDAELNLVVKVGAADRHLDAAGAREKERRRRLQEQHRRSGYAQNKSFILTIQVSMHWWFPNNVCYQCYQEKP